MAQHRLMAPIRGRNGTHTKMEGRKKKKDVVTQEEEGGPHNN